MLHFPICVIFTQEQEKDYEKGENVGYFFYNITYCKTVNQIVQGDCQKVTIEGLLFFFFVFSMHSIGRLMHLQNIYINSITYKIKLYTYLQKLNAHFNCTNACVFKQMVINNNTMIILIFAKALGTYRTINRLIVD